MEVVQLLGSQGFQQHQVLSGVGVGVTSHLQWIASGCKCRPMFADILGFQESGNKVLCEISQQQAICSLWTAVLVFYCFFFSKLSQNQWLQIIQIYYLTVQQVRSLTWVSLAVFLSLGPWENVLRCFFQLLGVTHIPWLMGPFLCLQSQQCHVSLAFYLLSQLSLTTAVKVYPLLRTCVIRLYPCS